MQVVVHVGFEVFGQNVFSSDQISIGNVDVYNGRDCFLASRVAAQDILENLHCPVSRLALLCVHIAKEHQSLSGSGHQSDRLPCCNKCLAVLPICHVGLREPLRSCYVLFQGVRLSESTHGTVRPIEFQAEAPFQHVKHGVAIVESEPLLRITERPKSIALAFPIESSRHPSLWLAIVDSKQIVGEPIQFDHVVRGIQGHCIVIHFLYARVVYISGMLEARHGVPVVACSTVSVRQLQDQMHVIRESAYEVL
mmetsp:Transcript_120/g.235  ORF Transcript_120/g.235 Transcript_120/m.235 type:complete len:252 (+) Transcript_120:618-1373(+)